MVIMVLPFVSSEIACWIRCSFSGSMLAVDDGRIAECGTHEELIAQGGIYKRFTAIRQQAKGWKL